MCVIFTFCTCTVIAGILSCDHKIGRHVVTVTSADKKELLEPSYDGATKMESTVMVDNGKSVLVKEGERVH